MTVINLKDELHEEVGKFILKDGKLEFPSVKNFVDKAVKKILEEVKKR